jgi:hypothetical protein
MAVCKNDRPCSKECEIETANNKETCKDEWEYTLVDIKKGKQAPIIVKVTKLLLILVVTLSVTMILYNGMMYIIQS